jgi:hypothetical protein
VSEEAGFNALLLRLRYDDGFAAYLNGVEVARRNAPEMLRHDSAAPSARPRPQALAVEEISLALRPGLLRPGANILALHGLNEGAAGPDFLILPELAAARATANRYLLTASPGAANASGVIDFVDDVHVSPERGFRSAAFDVELACATEGATIYYTTDGSDPRPQNPQARP